MTTDRTRLGLAAFVVFFALTSPSLSGQQTTPDDPFADDPFAILEEADRLAWVKNWTRAEPLFARAEQLFTESGDERNALYARVGRLRGQLPRLSILETSNQLAELLEDPLVQNDAELRLRVLTVKGDTDMDLDSDLARRDWTEALEVARSLGDTAWEARATGELGIIDFLQGDSAAAMIKMSTALTSATQSGDVGAQIRYLTLTGSGVAEFGNVDMGLGFLDNALAVAATHPDTTNPVMTYTAKAKALDLAGRPDEANALLQQAFDTASEVGALGAQADLRYWANSWSQNFRTLSSVTCLRTRLRKSASRSMSETCASVAPGRGTRESRTFRKMCSILGPQNSCQTFLKTPSTPEATKCGFAPAVSSGFRASAPAGAAGLR